MAFKMNGFSGFKIKSQQFMGRNQLENRLTSQVNNNRDLARNILKDRGHMNEDGSLTKEGMERDSMTASERAIDRASLRSGRNPSDYKYNPITNKATLQHG